MIARPGSSYAALYARLKTANERIRASQPGPESVADVILTALRAEHPHARYPAAIPFAARLTMALPDAAKDVVVRRLYGLGSLPRVTELARSSTRAENGGTSETADAHGLAVFAVGSGLPLLLMPYPHAVSVVGNPTMDLLLDRLASLGRRVVTFDPPSSGRSTRPMHLGMPEMLDCAEEALAALGSSGPVDVFGHSQGGVAALAFALERPERVRRLVLADTSSGVRRSCGRRGPSGTAATRTSGGSHCWRWCTWSCADARPRH